MYDAAVHASLKAGLALAKGDALPFRHNDLDHLEGRLKRGAYKEQVICVEGVYSTDGSLAPMGELLRLAERYNASLVVDEAHSVGLYGPRGEGRGGGAWARVIPFGKALGVQGAAIVGSRALKRALLNFAPQAIYTTALPSYALAAIRCSYARFPGMHREREALFALGVSSPIQFFLAGSAPCALALSQRAAKEGLSVSPLRSPTVRRGREGVRVCYHAYNTPEEVATLHRVLREGRGV